MENSRDLSGELISKYMAASAELISKYMADRNPLPREDEETGRFVATREAEQLAEFAKGKPHLEQVRKMVDAQIERLVARKEDEQLKQTHAVLAEFAKGKPHFERVRKTMASLLTPDASGRAIVPLKQGAADLDTAYEMACRTDPVVSEQMRSERMAAERKKMSEHRTSVRDSLRSVISEISDAKKKPTRRGSQPENGKPH